VTPSFGIRPGQTVAVRVHSGADVGFSVSECASGSDAGTNGCGSEQIFGNTGASGNATVQFRVESVASNYRGPATNFCTDQCVIDVSTEFAKFANVPISIASYSPVAQAPGACSGSQIAISSTVGGAALGHVGVILLFTNTSDATCLLWGYPTVAGLNPQGAQVVQARPTPSGYLGGLAPGKRPPAIHLAPGQRASAKVEGTDNPVGTARNCPTYRDLLVTPPDMTLGTVVDASLPGCPPLQVYPIVAGTTGDGPGW
jgi:hypothetical protein